jgi:hypothetical protein
VNFRSLIAINMLHIIIEYYDGVFFFSKIFISHNSGKIWSQPKLNMSKVRSTKVILVQAENKLYDLVHNVFTASEQKCPWGFFLHHFLFKIQFKKFILTYMSQDQLRTKNVWPFWNHTQYHNLRNNWNSVENIISYMVANKLFHKKMVNCKY